MLEIGINWIQCLAILGNIRYRETVSCIFMYMHEKQGTE